ncbi:MAG: FliM/FliN family flagellar motor switch protein [Limnohabitans sp.]
MAEAVLDAELDLQVLLRKLQISLSQLQTMQPGDVLPFKKNDHARMLVRDMPI